MTTEYLQIETTEASKSIVVPKEVRITREDIPGFAFVVPNGTPWHRVLNALAILSGAIVKVKG